VANFGNEVYGAGGWWPLVANKIVGIKVTLPVGGTVTSITQYNGTDSGAPHIQYAIYSLAGDLQGQTASYTLTTSYGWHTLDLITPVALAAGTYVIAYNVDASGGYTRFDAATDIMGDTPQTFDTWPASISVLYSTDYVLSFYATYGESSTELSVASAAFTFAATSPAPSTSVATLTIDNAYFGVASVSPVLVPGPWSEDFAGISQLTLYKFEVWFGGAWFDTTSASGYYLKSMNIKLGGAGMSPEPIAGTWSATFHNPDGMFHPNHPSSAYATLFQIGRKVRISVGRMHQGVPYYWQRMIGYMDAPKFAHGSRTVNVSGCDYSKNLTDTILRHPSNYFGTVGTYDSVSSSGVTGAELYDQNDAAEITTEVDAVGAGWADTNCTTSSVADAGGGSTYALRVVRGAATTAAHTHISALGTVTLGELYRVTFKSIYSVGTRYFTVQLFQTIDGVLKAIGISKMLSSSSYTTAAWVFTAIKSGALEARYSFANRDSVENDEFRVDVISVKKADPTWNRYELPEGCNGPYYVTLDDKPVWSGVDDETGWYYDEPNRYLFFDSARLTVDGTANVKIYYYTDQVPENVIARLLATSGLYGTWTTDAELDALTVVALAAMDYTPTGIILKRVGFPGEKQGPGPSAMGAVRMICERCNYRFWFDSQGVPHFKPTPTVGEIQFDFDKFGDLRDLSDFQDLNEIKNRVTIEGADQALFDTNARIDSRIKGEASDATSITAYLEKTHAITNNLFEDQTSLDAMCVTLLAAGKDPKLYAELQLFANVVPLEVGDTIRWRVIL
jgi:hypothetical protein